MALKIVYLNQFADLDPAQKVTYDFMRDFQ